MPALQMKAKSTTTCKRDGSNLHESEKSNKICKVSGSMVRVTPEAEYSETSDKISQKGFGKIEVFAQGHENQTSYDGDRAEAFSLVDEDSASDAYSDSVSMGKMDSSPSGLCSNMGTMFSPLAESNDVPCNVFDGVGREQIVSVPQVNDDDHGDRSNTSFNYQASHALDSYIYEMCLSGFSGDRSVLDGNTNYNILCDHEPFGANLIYDATEGFMLFPFPEETVEAKDSHHEGSCEEFNQISDYSWFHRMCHQSKPFSQELDAKPCQFDLEEVDYSDPESFIRNFPELSDESDSLPALVSKETSKKKHITLVLDLDETLVHSTMEPCEGADFTIQVFFDQKEHTIYVRQRPYLWAFLETVSKMFEIIIFTASQSIYAEKLLDVLDPDKKLFSKRVYRESCVFSDGTYIKDLTVLGIDLAKVFIIDNSPQVFRLQADNGIPIKSWFDDPYDSALISLLPFLETLVDVDDVRPIIATKFGVRK